MKVKIFIIFLMSVIILQSCDENKPHLYSRLPNKGEIISKDIFMKYERIYQNSKYYVLNVDLGGFTRDGISDDRLVVCDKNLKIVGTAMDLACYSLTENSIYICPAPTYRNAINIFKYIWSLITEAPYCDDSEPFHFDDHIERNIDLPKDLFVKLDTVKYWYKDESLYYNIVDYHYDENDKTK